MYYSSIIVDDEHLIRSSLANKLGSCDSVIAAGSSSNGVKCLEWLEQHFADICITDVRMPHMDGLELIQHINEKYPWMSCIVVSSHDDFTYVRKSMQLHVVDYVMKPVELSVLQQAVTVTVDRLKRSRKDKAAAIFMRKISHQSGMLERWVTNLQTLQEDNMYMLIVETLEMLEGWADGQYYLLNELSMVWLEFVLEEIRKYRVDVQLDEYIGESLEPYAIPRERARFVFRLAAVGRMEEAARQMLKAMRQAKGRSSSRTIDQVKAYLQQHYAEKINLQDVADEVAISRTYLANLFKQETGNTIWGYLVAIRMQRARELLLTSTLKSYEVALQVGYENSIHFSKLFKDHYGLTPMEFKKRMHSTS
ncbi:two-component system, response regulator YesN [Paenibacillus sp. UNCCL117]|uniref:response regulator transcription factor n=1 Tax=unclassified Paenibacillus TaxID=185978 RepID=UPI000883215D|nr:MULTISPECIES: response regulator [unclassified Paenibacillus]SDD65374.1 two-component system, response regulator YesN [Paenibacillus sp. cl123]SFW58136.1 two-component system, response regulator YesN [Paenibacillus sp. UNCCL117]